MKFNIRERRIIVIQFSCSKCNHEYRVPDEYAGKKARCKKCKNVNLIPESMVAASSAVGMTFDSENFDYDSFDSGAEYLDAFQELLKWEKQAPPADEEEV